MNTKNSKREQSVERQGSQIGKACWSISCPSVDQIRRVNQRNVLFEPSVRFEDVFLRYLQEDEERKSPNIPLRYLQKLRRMPGLLASTSPEEASMGERFEYSSVVCERSDLR